MNIKCEASGSWSPQPPLCIGRLCEQLDDPQHGSVSFTNNRRYPTVATYTCDPGYKISSGSETRDCRPGSGLFDGSAGLCTGIICGEVVAPEHGYFQLSSDTRQFPVTAEFSCEPGYELVGDTLISCQTDATWPQSPICRGIICPEPIIENGLAETTNYRYPASAFFRCKPGHGFSGYTERVCSTSGEWGELPSCTPCPVNSYPPSATSTCVACSNGRSTNGLEGADRCECVPGKEPNSNDDTCLHCKGKLK